MLDVLARKLPFHPLGNCGPSHASLFGDIGAQAREPPGKTVLLDTRLEWERDTVSGELFSSEHNTQCSPTLRTCQGKSVEIPQAVADAVIALRERLGYSSQHRFAVFLEVSHQAVAGWEQARRNVQPLQLKQFLALATEHGWHDLAAVFEARLAEKRQGKPQIVAPPARPEPQLSPVSREFNEVAVVTALRAILAQAPKAFRDKIVADVVGGAEKYTDWSPDAAQEEPAALIEFPDEGPMNRIPVLADRAAAGGGFFVRDTDIDSYAEIPARYTPKGSGGYVGLKLRGKSMAPEIEDGSIVIVEKAERDWSTARDKVVAAKVEGQTLVKRVARESTKDKIIFRSDNPAFEDIIVAKPKISPMVRRVVFWRRPVAK